MSLAKKLFGISTSKSSKIIFADKTGNKAIVGVEQEFFIPKKKTERFIDVEYETVLDEEEGDWLTPGEARSLYGIPLKKLRKMCREKLIDCKKRKGKWHISSASLKQQLSS